MGDNILKRIGRMFMHAAGASVVTFETQHFLTLVSGVNAGGKIDFTNGGFRTVSALLMDIASTIGEQDFKNEDDAKKAEQLAVLIGKLAGEAELNNASNIGDIEGVSFPLEDFKTLFAGRPLLDGIILKTLQTIRDDQVYDGLQKIADPLQRPYGVTMDGTAKIYELLGFRRGLYAVAQSHADRIESDEKKETQGDIGWLDALFPHDAQPATSQEDHTKRLEDFRSKLEIPHGPVIRMPLDQLEAWVFKTSNYPDEAGEPYADVAEHLFALSLMGVIGDKAFIDARNATLAIVDILKAASKNPAAHVDIPLEILKPLFEAREALGRTIVDTFDRERYYPTVLPDCDFYRGIVDIQRRNAIAPYDQASFQTEDDQIIDLMLLKYPEYLEELNAQQAEEPDDSMDELINLIGNSLRP